MNSLEKNLKVVIKLLNMIKDKDYTFILSGSTSLALQGVEIEVNDIDIVTDKKGALALDNLLKQYNVSKLKYSETEKYQSYFGKYEIDGVKVEIMGEFKYKLKTGKWSLANHLHKVHYIKYNGVEIPVLHLRQELIEYQNSDKILTIKKIQDKLNTNNKKY